MSVRGRGNLPVASSISSSAEARANRDNTASPSRVETLNARSLAEEPIVRRILDGTAVRPRITERSPDRHGRGVDYSSV
jgi:hypothetical protein